MSNNTDDAIFYGEDIESRYMATVTSTPSNGKTGGDALREILGDWKEGRCSNCGAQSARGTVEIPRIQHYSRRGDIIAVIDTVPYLPKELTCDYCGTQTTLK
jgi:hypothetical protein